MTMLLVLLCQSTALLSLGFLALHLTRKRGPAVQTLVGRATLSGAALLLLLLPLSGRIAPVWRIPTPVRSSPTLPIRSNAEGHKREGGELPPVGAPLAAPSTVLTPSAPPPPVPVSTTVSVPDTAEPAHQEGAEKTESAEKTEGAASNAPTLSVALPNPSFRKDPATAARGSKAVGLPALLLLLWLTLCQWHLIRLRRAAHPVTDGPAAALLAELTPHPPLLLTHPSVHSPFLAGTRRPAIFLPQTYATDFGPDTLRAVFGEFRETVVI